MKHKDYMIFSKRTFWGKIWYYHKHFVILQGKLGFNYSRSRS